MDGLLPFLEALLPEFSGQFFDAEKVAAAVNSTYHWNLNSDVVENFIPQLERTGWLKRQTNSDKRAVYLINQRQPEKSILAKKKANDVLTEIGISFQKFIIELSPLTSYQHQREALEEILLNWLVSIDGTDRDAIVRAVNQILETGKLEAATRLPLDEYSLSILQTEEAYLCTRFIDHLHKTKSPLFDQLVDIAAVGQLAEVVQEFQKPNQKNLVRRVDVSIYLDAPFLMDLLGLSGTHSKDNAQYIIEGLREVGAQILVFRHSIDEMVESLRAMKATAKHERYGKTADAIRRREVMPEYVDHVIANPAHYLEVHKVLTLQQSVDQFPGQQGYFSGELRTDLLGRLNWHENLRARERDVDSITIIMRRRTGNRTRNPFQARHLFITNSHLLAQFAKRFCSENHLGDPEDVPPVLHQRTISNALWVTLGAKVLREVPKRQLLAACEAVLRSKPAVIQRLVQTARQVSPEQIGQLELMLEEPRAVQALMDLTLGVDSVLTASNLDSVVDAMRSSITQEAVQEKVDEFNSKEKEYRSTIKHLEQIQQNLTVEKGDAITKLTEADARDQRLVEGWVKSARTLGARYYGLWKFAAFLALFVLGGLTYISSASLIKNPDILTPFSLLVALLTIGCAIWTTQSKPAQSYLRYVQKQQERLLQERAREASREDLLAKYECLLEGQFLIRNRFPDEGVRKGDTLF
jgi:hypothetical protein